MTAEEVADLPAGRVDDGEALAGPEEEARAGLGCEPRRSTHASVSSVSVVRVHLERRLPGGSGWRGRSTASASVLSPWSATIGLMSPGGPRRGAGSCRACRRSGPRPRSSSNCSCGLKTRVGSGARRATRDAAGCRPTMKYARAAGAEGEVRVVGVGADAAAAHDSSSASCRRWSSPKSEASKSASLVGRGPRKVAMKEWKPLLALDGGREARAAARGAVRGRRGRPCRRGRRVPRLPRRKTDLAPRQGNSACVDHELEGPDDVGLGRVRQVHPGEQLEGRLESVVLGRPARAAGRYSVGVGASCAYPLTCRTPLVQEDVPTPGSLSPKPCTRGRGSSGPSRAAYSVVRVPPSPRGRRRDPGLAHAPRPQDVPLAPRALPVRALRARLHDAARAARRDDPVGADDGRRGQQGDADRLREVPDGRRLRERRPRRARDDHPADRLLPRQDRLAHQARHRRSSSGSTARCRRGWRTS